MKYTILVENALGGLVGDLEGVVRGLPADRVCVLSDEYLNLYVPITEKSLSEEPDELPVFGDYASKALGLKVRAGFYVPSKTWYVVI